MADLKFNKLYFLGPEGTYAEKAMKLLVKMFNIEAGEIIPKNPVTKILQTVDNENDSAAVLPIENSIEGIVRETIDNMIVLKDNSLKITAETIIPISHCLVSVSDEIKNIKTVLSHSQALDQCSGFISKNLPDVQIISVPSTAYAAQFAKEHGSEYAAIASETSAEKFGLNILARNVNDEKDNKTRFILLSRTELKPEKQNKTSIFFSVKNEPGTLFNVLKIFNEYNINLLYIESRPSKKLLGEYNFCVDIDGHKSDKNILSAVSDIKKITNSLKITGSYPKFTNNTVTIS